MALCLLFSRFKQLPGNNRIGSVISGVRLIGNKFKQNYILLV